MNLTVLEYGGKRYDWVVDGLKISYGHGVVDFIQVVVKKEGEK
jgi:hypothetical protein